MSVCQEIATETTAAPSAQRPERPAWLPGTHRSVRPGDRLYITADPPHSFVLEGASGIIISWFSQFDGQRSWDQQISEAQARGISEKDAAGLLSALAEAGLLADAAADPGESWKQAAAQAVVFGAGPLADELLRLMGGSRTGGPVPRLDAMRAGAEVPGAAAASLAVLALDRAVADSVEAGFAHHLMTEGVPVLVVGAGNEAARVGPLVIPGRTACLRCEQFARSDRDQDWPAVARELSIGVRPHADFLMAAAGASEAARVLRAYVNGGLAACEAADAVLECGPRGSAWRRRALLRHRMCGCEWS